MPFSHHSHSGQFCGHGSNTLEEMVQTAISKKMTTFCLTEHLPREEIDLYPEEAGHTQASLEKLYDDFYHEARRLQIAYAGQIQLFIGFESDWIRASSQAIVEGLLARYSLDLFVGSVHHVHTIPIDFDHALYQRARAQAGGTDQQIFQDYFDAQWAMLRTLRPPVVGHFDLIRLKSDDPDRSLRTWPSVWTRIARNLEFVAAYGGVMELNASSLRKGMCEAYPQSEICQAFRELGGRFTLSDDSHDITQVGLNLDRTWATVTGVGIEELYYLVPRGKEEEGAEESGMAETHDARFPNVCWKRISADAVRTQPFFHASGRSDA